MQNFLQRLGVSDQTLAFANQSFKQPLGVSLVRMITPYKVHGDIGIHEGHGFIPELYPLSISPSIWSISPVGKLCRAAARTAASFLETSPPGSCRRAGESAWRTHSAIDIRRERAIR